MSMHQVSYYYYRKSNVKKVESSFKTVNLLSFILTIELFLYLIIFSSEFFYSCKMTGK